MEGIHDIVKKVFTDITVKTMDEQKKLGEDIEKVLKNNKMCGVKISGYRDGHLSLNVDSSAQLYQLNLLKNKLLEQIKKDLPDLKKISIRIGSTT